MSGVPSEQSQQPQQDQQPDDGWGEKPIPLAYSWSFWFDDFLTSPPSTSPPASPAESPRIGLLPLPTPPSVSPPPIRGTAAYAANLRLVGSFSSIQVFRFLRGKVNKKRIFGDTLITYLPWTSFLLLLLFI